MADTSTTPADLASASVVPAARTYPMPSTSGVDIHSEIYHRRQVTWLVAKGAPDALGLWVACLLEMRAADPQADTINFETLASLGGERRHAELLIRSGLWIEVCQDEYQPPRFDADGHPLWRPAPPRRRQGIPDSVRAAVYERDNHRCVSCDSADDLTLDHIYPWSLGGPDTVENLRVLCRPCNSRKGARV